MVMWHADTSLKDDEFFCQLRREEFHRLDEEGHTYLDYAGANLYPQSLVEKHLKFLTENIFGNPHSENPTAQLSSELILKARQRILDFFNAQDYQCVFTANATGALKIIGECYPFSMNSHLLLTADNHNSVNGLRQYCKRKGGTYSYALLNPQDLTIDADSLSDELHGYPDRTEKLFAFPAQSNASGIKHSLTWVQKARDNSWDVLLDAAALASASSLDLSIVNADFVTLSFYKLFGYPTGVGCVLIHKSKFLKLEKPWFAGGTVSFASVRSDNYALLSDYQKFEDGTVNFLELPAVNHGLDFLQSVGLDRISSRMQRLTAILFQALNSLRHTSGLPVVKIYGPDNLENRGAIIMFDIIDKDGQLFPPEWIEKAAAADRISVRTGCFCNPGVNETNKPDTADWEAANLEEYGTGNPYTASAHPERIAGAVRVSLGLPTILADLERLLHFIERFRNESVENFSARGRIKQKTDAKQKSMHREAENCIRVGNKFNKMAKKLDHRQIQGILSSLGETKIVNLDASIKSLITPIGESISKHSVGEEVSLHILCCNEYALVTGLTGNSLVDIESLSGNIRGAIGKRQGEL